MSFWDKMRAYLGYPSVRHQQEVLLGRIQRNDIEGVHRLLELGVNPNFGNTGYIWDANGLDLPPVFISLRHDPAIIKLLFKYGANPHTTCLTTSPSGESSVGLLEFHLTYVEQFDQSPYANIFMYEEKSLDNNFLEIYKILRQHLTLNEDLRQHMKTSKSQLVIQCSEWELKNYLERELADAPQKSRRRI